MPDYTFTFPTKLNISLQVGDVAYYAVTQTVAGESGGDSFDTAEQSGIIRVGKVTAINQSTNTITCNCSDTFEIPEDPFPFMFFSKDNTVNTGSIIGYYANVRFVNNSTVKGKLKGEMFAASCDIFESSK
tara:strand:+ start:304 stop:693 length:390 start_codon:yes stop_codon:yes gene_type:complete